MMEGFSKPCRVNPDSASVGESSMRKKLRKLTLTRETVQPLTAEKTTAVGAADTLAQCVPVTYSCSACVSYCQGRCVTQPAYCVYQ